MFSTTISRTMSPIFFGIYPKRRGKIHCRPVGRRGRIWRGKQLSLSLSSSSTLKKSTKVIGDVGYVFRKEFNEGWFTGIVVKIMEDGDQRCEYWTVMLKTYFWMILCSLLNWIQIIAPWNQGEARYCTRGTQMWLAILVMFFERIFYRNFSIGYVNTPMVMSNTCA